MRERPTIPQVMGWLEETRAEVEDGEYDVNKLSLAQLPRYRNQENRSLREKNDSLKKQNDALNEKQKNENKRLQALNVTKSKVLYFSLAICGLFLSLLFFQFVS